MKLTPGYLHHIYNRGNNRQPIFFNRENYLFFLKKIRTHLLPYCHILAYCLMPNHFHLLVYVKDETDPAKLSSSFKIMISSYTRAINKQENRTGSLFQQNSKDKNLNQDSHYPFICFHYIHQNPVAARLVTGLADWEFSSFKDYVSLRNGTLCNQSLARQLLDLPADPHQFYQLSQRVFSKENIQPIF